MTKLRRYDPQKDGRVYVEKRDGSRELYDEKKHGRAISDRTGEVGPQSQWFVEDKEAMIKRDWYDRPARIVKDGDKVPALPNDPWYIYGVNDRETIMREQDEEDRKAAELKLKSK